MALKSGQHLVAWRSSRVLRGNRGTVDSLLTETGEQSAELYALYGLHPMETSGAGWSLIEENMATPESMWRQAGGLGTIHIPPEGRTHDLIDGERLPPRTEVPGVGTPGRPEFEARREGTLNHFRAMHRRHAHTVKVGPAFHPPRPHSYDAAAARRRRARMRRPNPYGPMPPMTDQIHAGSVQATWDTRDAERRRVAEQLTATFRTIRDRGRISQMQAEGVAYLPTDTIKRDHFRRLWRGLKQMERGKSSRLYVDPYENPLDVGVIVDEMPEGYYFGEGLPTPASVPHGSTAVVRASEQFLHMGPARWGYSTPFAEMKRQYTTKVAVGDRVVFNLHNESEMAILSQLVMDENWVARTSQNRNPIHLLMPIGMRHEHQLRQFQQYVMRRLVGQELKYGDAQDPLRMEIDVPTRGRIVGALASRFPNVDWRVQWTDDYDQSERFLREFHHDAWFDNDGGRAPRMPIRRELEFAGTHLWQVTDGELRDAGPWTMKVDLLPGPEDTGVWTTVSQRPRFSTGPKRWLTGYDVHLQSFLPNPQRMQARQSVIRRRTGDGWQDTSMQIRTTRSYGPERRRGGGSRKSRRHRGLLLRPEGRPPAIDTVGPEPIEDIWRIYSLAPDELQREMDIFRRHTLVWADDSKDPLGVVLSVQQRWEDDRLFYRIHIGDKNTREVMYEYLAAYDQIAKPRHGMTMSPMIGQAFAAGMQTLREGLRPHVSSELSALTDDQIMDAIYEATQKWTARGRSKFALNEQLARVAAGVARGLRPGDAGDVFDERTLNPLSVKLGGMSAEDRRTLRDVRRLSQKATSHGGLDLQDATALERLVRTMESWDDGLAPLEKRQIAAYVTDHGMHTLRDGTRRRVRRNELSRVQALLAYARQETISRFVSGSADVRDVAYHTYPAVPQQRFAQRVFQWADAPTDEPYAAMRRVRLGDILGEMYGLPGSWAHSYDPHMSIDTTLSRSEYRYVAQVLFDQSRSVLLNEEQIQNFVGDIELARVEASQGGRRQAIRGVVAQQSRLRDEDTGVPHLRRSTVGADNYYMDDLPDDALEGGLRWAALEDDLSVSEVIATRTSGRHASTLHGAPGDAGEIGQAFSDIRGLTIFDKIEEAFANAGRSDNLVEPSDISQVFAAGNFGFSALKSDRGWSYGATYEYSENLVASGAVLAERSFHAGAVRLSMPTLDQMQRGWMEITPKLVDAGGGSKAIEMERTKIQGFHVRGATQHITDFFTAYEVMARSAFESGMAEALASKTQQYTKGWNLDWAPRYTHDDLMTIFNDRHLEDAVRERLKRQRRASNAVVQGMLLSEAIDSKELADSTLDRYLREAYPGVGQGRRVLHRNMLRMAREIRGMEPILRAATSNYYRQQMAENVVARALPALKDQALGFIRKRSAGDRTNLVWGLDPRRVSDQRGAVRSWQRNVTRSTGDYWDFITDHDDGLLEIDNYVMTFHDAHRGLVTANVARLEQQLGLTADMARDMSEDAAQRKVLKGILLNTVVETDEDLVQYFGKESHVLAALGDEGRQILSRAVESETAENIQLASHMGQMETLAALEQIQHSPELPIRPQSVSVDMAVSSASDAVDVGDASGTVISYARRMARAGSQNVHFGTLGDALRKL